MRERFAQVADQVVWRRITGTAEVAIKKGEHPIVVRAGERGLEVPKAPHPAPLAPPSL